MRVPPERVHSVFNHPWGDKPANNNETYGLSTLGAGSDLSRTYSLITCTTSFTRLLTAFRRYIQRLVSMSIADGLASTNLLPLYIRAIYLHIYVLCFENTRYIWIRQRLLVTWCISHVRAAATIMFMVVRTHDRSHLNVNPRHRLSIDCVVTCFNLLWNESLQANIASLSEVSSSLVLDLFHRWLQRLPDNNRDITLWYAQWIGLR